MPRSLPVNDGSALALAALGWSAASASPRHGCTSRAGTQRVRALLCLVVLVVLALGNIAAAAPVKLSGRLTLIDDHQFGLQYYLMDSTGGLGKVYELPGQPIDSSTRKPLESGALLDLTCELSGPAGSTTCASVSGAKAKPQDPRLSFSATTVPEIKLLVLLVTVTGACSWPAGYSVDQVSNFFWGRDGYADFFNQCSYGKMKIPQASSKVLPVNIQCSNIWRANCKPFEIEAAAEEEARKQLNVANVQHMYSHITVLMPPAAKGVCPGWEGQALTPGAYTWLQSSPKGIEAKGTVMQELLHNVGLRHSWRNDVEYQDDTTAMGMGQCCPSAYELSFLAWAPGYPTMQSVDLKAGTFVQKRLPATQSGQGLAEGVFIKIKPDWVRGYSDNVYMAMRARVGGDKGLAAQYDKQIHVHYTNASSEDAAKSGVSPDPKVEFITVVGPNSRYIDIRYSFVLTTGALSSDGLSIEVGICRFTTSDSECSSSGGGSGPQRAPSPSPSRASPSPATPSPASITPSPQPSPSPSPSPVRSPSPSPRPAGHTPSPSPAPAPRIPDNRSSPPVPEPRGTSPSPGLPRAGFRDYGSPESCKRFRPASNSGIALFGAELLYTERAAADFNFFDCALTVSAAHYDYIGVLGATQCYGLRDVPWNAAEGACQRCEKPIYTANWCGSATSMSLYMVEKILDLA